MWSVEQAMPDDASDILAVQKDAFRANQAKYDVPLPAMEETVMDVLADMREAIVLVARQSGGVIGSARCRMEGSACRVYNLAVETGHAQMDVGSSLMQAIEDRARSTEGIREVVLETGLRDGPAIEFYLKLGYRPYRLIPDDETHLDMVCFRKPLEP